MPKIEVSEETYEKIKDQLSVSNKFELYTKYVIVRSYGAGCFAGSLQHKDNEDRRIILNNARRLWYWDGAASLSQLSVEGVKNPAKCKFTQETNSHEIFDVLEVIPVTDVAQRNIRAVPVWKV